MAGGQGMVTDDELEGFKTHINLSEYAATEGYVLDRKASSRNSAVMRATGGDKIVIARAEDGHWVYFSIRDERDNGSIIDFVQNRRRCSLGRVRQELRPWSAGARHLVRPQPDLFARELETISRDRARVLAELLRMKPLLFHRYLEEERCIPARLLKSSRFAGKLKVDFRANAIFPHADQQGPCGYEIKNRAFTGFAPGGEKGLWFSAASTGDTRLVIAESGIDALSHAVLHPDAHARYASTGGAMNPSQPALIRAAIERMGQGGRIVIATDNDEGGRDLADQIEALARETGRADLTIVRDLPPGAGQDWNDVLKARATVSAPPAPNPVR
jgi:hypothetical protein